MRTTILLLAVLTLSTCTNGHEIKVRVIDENRRPLPGAEVAIIFMRPVNGTSRVFRGVSGTDGRYGARETITIGALVTVKKPGYYNSEMRNEFGARDYNVDLVMRRRISPIPLVVRDLELAIPKDAGRIGVDLEAGDWVAPFGKGTVSDFEVRFSNSFSGYQYSGEEWDRIRFAKVNANLSEEALRDVYGKWDAAATITASGGLGFVFEEPDFNPFSELTMPHEAPEEGYGPKFEMEGSTYDSSRMEIEKRPLFLRTRAEVRDGKVVRANYVKLPEGIQLDARGSLRFTYYFNPRANDRNLEFDPRQNLAKEQERSYPP
ncbi:MAG: carboxypeptidase regulatory-like domain-containing protein [Verrucomicrobiae bacterium]|nr:carboxypeptidase regulatory-like domain-containing protein [Verrucomicrobiae bacterium]